MAESKTTMEPSGNLWHTANRAFSGEERHQYNMWRGRLTLAYHALKDALEVIDGNGIGPWSDDRSRKKAYAKLCELKTLLAETPDWMTI